MSNNVVQLLATVAQFYSYVVLVRVILTWFPNVGRDNPIVDFIHQITDPVLIPIRKALPAMGSIDFSPLVLLVGLHILRTILENMASGM